MIEDTKLTPKELAEALGMSHDWVLTYLPDKYKNQERAKAGRASAEARSVGRRPTEEGAARRAAEEGLLDGVKQKPAEEEEPEAIATALRHKAV